MKSDEPLVSLHVEPSRLASFGRPVLVIGLEGWVDAGLGASNAIAELLTEERTEVLATFDGETLIDQRARRPVARIENGVTTSLTWPEIQLRAGRDHDGADMVFLVGPEPDFRWRPFVDTVVDLGRRLGVRMVVPLGAFPAPAPHTRPVRLAATVPPGGEDLAMRVGIVEGELEVPAGVTSAIELAFGLARVPTVSLWARVPHYVAAMPFPEASAALLDGLAAVAGLSIDTSSLHAAADVTRRRVDELIANSDEHLDMVRRLEHQFDATEGNAFGMDGVPSGDEIAAELERFLRGEQ